MPRRLFAFEVRRRCSVGMNSFSISGLSVSMSAGIEYFPSATPSLIAIRGIGTSRATGFPARAITTSAATDVARNSYPRAPRARMPRGRMRCATRNGLGNRLVIALTLPSSFGTCITSSIRRSRNDQVSALSADLSLSQ